jgi:hypothetical protein
VSNLISWVRWKKLIWWRKQRQLLKGHVVFKLMDVGKCLGICISLMTDFRLKLCLGSRWHPYHPSFLRLNAEHVLRCPAPHSLNVFSP